MTIKNERGFIINRPASFPRNAEWSKRLAAAMQWTREQYPRYKVSMPPLKLAA